MAKKTFVERIRQAFKAKDEEALERELENASEDGEGEGETEVPSHHVVVNVNGMSPDLEGSGDKKGAKDAMNAIAKSLDAFSAKFDGIEARLAKIESSKVGDEGEPEEEKRKREEEAKAAVDAKRIKDEEEANAKAIANEEAAAEEEEKKSMDAATVAVMRPEFQSTVSKAEILAPGVKLPNFDARASKKTVADAMCGLRKQALQKAFADEKRRPFVTRVAGEAPNFDSMSCDHMAVVFNAASELARAEANKPRVSLDRLNLPQGGMTAEKMQKLNEEHRKSLRSA